MIQMMYFVLIKVVVGIREAYIMKKILLPIDGTQRSIDAAEFVAQNFKPDDVEVISVTVREDYYAFAMTQINPQKVIDETMPIFGTVEEILKCFKLTKKVLVGRKAGEEIVLFAKENNIDTIVMTKSSKRGIKNFIGSVASYVVSHSACTVYSIPENNSAA